MNILAEKIRFRGRDFYVWRDDLYSLALGDQKFSGNKARKLYHFLIQDFPQIKCVISYGSAQSNMLLSLSQLAREKGWQLEFYVDHIPDNLQRNPRGNYGAALQLGAQVLRPANQEGNLEKWVFEQDFDRQQESLFIAEGGRTAEAETGIRLQAQNISQWLEEAGLNQPKIMLPSGTGTTALFLQKHLDQYKPGVQVMTCACVGGDVYLQEQFESLDPSLTTYPEILPTKKKYYFGKLYPEFYQIWNELKTETGIEFELLYDPLGWLTLMNYLQGENAAEDILYIHQGGLTGNQTMLERYQRKFGA